MMSMQRVSLVPRDVHCDLDHARGPRPPINYACARCWRLPKLLIVEHSAYSDLEV